jgi:hypothetical protein
MTLTQESWEESYSRHHIRQNDIIFDIITNHRHSISCAPGVIQIHTWFTRTVDSTGRRSEERMKRLRNLFTCGRDEGIDRRGDNIYISLFLRCSRDVRLLSNKPQWCHWYAILGSIYKKRSISGWWGSEGREQELGLLLTFLTKETTEFWTAFALKSSMTWMTPKDLWTSSSCWRQGE